MGPWNLDSKLAWPGGVAGSVLKLWARSIVVQRSVLNRIKKAGLTVLNKRMLLAIET